MSDSPVARPRVEGEREREILDATLDVLVDQGYDKLTFDVVAARARAGKATLYRRWESKPALVMAAVQESAECATMQAPLPDHGSLRADLEALNQRAGSKGARMSEVMGAISSASHRDADLREAFVSTFAQPQIDMFATILERARERGEIDADADIEMLSRVVPAMAVHHTHLHGTKPEPSYLLRVLNSVLLPAAGGTPLDLSLETPERRG